MALRPYQLEALDASKRRHLAGCNRQLISLPTGTGKTVIFANLPRHHQIQKKMLVLVHRRELARQAEEKLRRYNPRVKIGVEMGSEESWGKNDIVVAGVQTLGHPNNGRILRFHPEEYDVIICDEAHHATADTYRRIFRHFGLENDDCPILLLGVTATPSRSDGVPLGSIFKETIFEMPTLNAIRDGWLCDLRAFRIRTQTDLDRVRATQDSDFLDEALAPVIDNKQRNALIVQEWAEYGKQRQTVVFCSTIDHGRHLASAFQAQGVEAECVCGSDSKQERDRKLQDHKAGRIKVLTNCGILVEGYDDWQIGCIVLARPTKSELLFQQMIGRGTRIEEGIGNLVEARRNQHPVRKEDCIILDVVDNSVHHRLITSALIFGYDYDFDLRGVPISRVGRPASDRRPSKPRIYTPNELVQATIVEEVDLFAPRWSSGLLNRSVLQWFRKGNSFILPLPGKESIQIDYNEHWAAQGTVGGSTFRGSTSETFTQAFEYSERMLSILGKKLIERLEAEETATSTTPVQRELLFDVDVDCNPRRAKESVAHVLAAAYQDHLNARPITPLLPIEFLSDEDQVAHLQDVPEPQVEVPVLPEETIEEGPPSRDEPVVPLHESSFYLPEPWLETGGGDLSLRWYATDETGYAMPLPDSGELVLSPHKGRWISSGEIDGIVLPQKVHPSLEAAFRYLVAKLELHGESIQELAAQEKEATGEDITPLQLALLRNLLGCFDAKDIRDRNTAKTLLEGCYANEYGGGDRTGDTMPDAHIEELLMRYGLLWKEIEGDSANEHGSGEGMDDDISDAHIEEEVQSYRLLSSRIKACKTEQSV